MTTWSQINDPTQWVGVTSGNSPPLNYDYAGQGPYFWWPNGASDLSITFNPGVALPEPGILYYQWLVFNANPADGGISDETLAFQQVVGGGSIYSVEWSTITGAPTGSVNPGSGSGQTPDLSGMTGFTLENSPGGLGVFGIRFSLTPFAAPSYSAPVLTGTIPNPIAQPLQGELTWTPALAPDAPILLQHFDTDVSDSSGNNIPFVLAAPASITTSGQKFGAGCFEFLAINSNGSNDIAYSAITAGGLLDLAPLDNWTIEGWINPNATGNTAQVFLGIGRYHNGFGNNAGLILANAGGTSGQIQVTLYGANVGGGPAPQVSVAPFPAGQWSHFAIVKQAAAGTGGLDLFSVYINGVGNSQSMLGPYTSWGAAGGALSYFVYGGYWDQGYEYFLTGTATNAGGFFDEMRVTPAAVYTANFTPPAAPFSNGGTPATGYDLYRDGVSIFTEVASDLASLLLHFDGDFTDSSVNNLTVIPSGGAAATGTPKFGSASFALSATNSSTNLAAVVAIAPGGPLDLRTGDFTIEGWFQYAGTYYAGVPLILFDYGDATYGSPGNSLGFYVSVYDNGRGTANFEILATNGLLSVNADFLTLAAGWHHFAIVSYQGTPTIYIDGVNSVTTGGTTGAWSTWPSGVTPVRLTIGLSPVISSSVRPGFLDEFRVIKLAVYTANFTPPTAPFSPGSGLTLAFLDTVPAYGTYDYQVFPWDGTMDLLNGSNIFPLTYAAPSATNLGFLDDELICGAFFGGVLNLVEFVYMPEREPFLEGATNMILNRYKQEPGDVRQRGVDYTFFMVPGELVQNVTVSGIYVQGVLQSLTDPLVTPLIVNEVIIDPLGQKFAYTVSGGQDGIEYRVQFTTTTQIQTSEVTEIFSINVLIEDSFP